MKQTHRLLVMAGMMGGLAACSAEDSRSRAAQEAFEAETAAGAPAGRVDTAATESPALVDPDTGWTAGLVEKDGDRVATLMEVRTASHEAYDRIVFEFAGEQRPGYRIEYVDRPIRQCGSGDSVPLAGDAWLSLRFYPANAHTEEGQPTVLERKRSWSDPAANLKALELTCDFEAVTEWVAGVAWPGQFRVLELSSPARIAVDVKRR